MTQSISVRPLTRELAPTVRAVRPSWADVVGGALGRIANGQGQCLVAFVGDSPAGLAELTHDDLPEIRNVGVLERYRSQGVGTALVEAAEQAAAPAPRVGVRVGVDNADARRLYQRLGYAATGQTTTTTYEYLDDEGVRHGATETDEWLVKKIAGS